MLHVFAISGNRIHRQAVDCVWNVMAHAQKPYFVFRRNGRVHLNRRGRQFSRLLSAEVCASAVIMVDTPFSEVVWRVLATHSIRQFPLHFPSRASPCAITFQRGHCICFVRFIAKVRLRFRSWQFHIGRLFGSRAVSCRFLCLCQVLSNTFNYATCYTYVI
jgi:hypothetical protein